MNNKAVYIIAGPNGSGKTTFARMFLPDYVNCPNFVNADLIAQGLAPFEPRSAAIKAGRLVLQQIHEFSGRGVDFAFPNRKRKFRFTAANRSVSFSRSSRQSALIDFRF